MSTFVQKEAATNETYDNEISSSKSLVGYEVGIKNWQCTSWYAVYNCIPRNLLSRFILFALVFSFFILT